jgi:hypothetical protein
MTVFSKDQLEAKLLYEICSKLILLLSLNGRDEYTLTYSNIDFPSKVVLQCSLEESN